MSSADILACDNCTVNSFNFANFIKVKNKKLSIPSLVCNYFKINRNGTELFQLFVQKAPRNYESQNAQNFKSLKWFIVMMK